MVAYGRFTLAIGVDKGVYTQKAGLSLVATPPKISHTGRHCVGCVMVPPNGTALAVYIASCPPIV
jgi:hypothetical protein